MKHPRSPDVFLLGAGFSRAISPEMPLLQGLAERVRRRARARPSRQTVGLMQQDFAHALSYLEQAKPWMTEADNLRDRALFLEFCTAIAQDLDDTVERIAGRGPAGVPRWLATLVRYWHRERCTVISLNYDTLIETLSPMIPLDDGSRLSAQRLYPPLLTRAGARGGGARSEPLPPSFRLLKLHGSTNWYYSGRAAAQGEPIFFVPPPPQPPAEDAARRHAFELKAVADKYPFLVPPIYDKTALLTHETIRALWFEAGEALRHGRRLVCLGYSLPDSDLTMKHFLRTSCGNRLRIEVVDPARAAGRNFKAMFAGTRLRVSQRARFGRIAGFVASLA